VDKSGPKGEVRNPIGDQAKLNRAEGFGGLMYNRIVVPLDGSELAAGILPYVRSLARQLEVPVTLLQVIDPEVVSSYTTAADPRQVDTVAAAMKVRSGEYLDSLRSSFAQALPVDHLIEMGNPAETIVKVAARDPGILIAMATHGRSGFQRWTMGSVADKVLHASSNHLFLMRPRAEPAKPHQEQPLTKIVVPLDGSKVAETILPSVVALAQKMGAEILLVRAYTLPLSTYSAEEDFSPNIGELQAELKVEATQYLDRIVQELKAKGVAKVSGVVLEGSAAAEVIDFATKTPDSIVAMCTHGRSGMRRWVLGSITERVVQFSGDPVLIIRSQS
jgi:nucleotide-binding universal stress UspA family protein